MNTMKLHAGARMRAPRRARRVARPAAEGSPSRGRSYAFKLARDAYVRSCATSTSRPPCWLPDLCHLSRRDVAGAARDQCCELLRTSIYMQQSSRCS